MTFNNNYVRTLIQDEVSAICAPLFECTKITRFEFNRWYKDGHALILNSFDAKIIDEFFVQALYPSWSELETYYQNSRILFINRDFLTCSAIQQEQKWKNNLEFVHQFEIDERFYLTYKYNDYYDSFGFYTSLDHQMPLNYYLEILNPLEEFSRYFYRAAASLINNCEKSRTQLHENFFHSQNEQLNLDSDYLMQLLQQHKPKNSTLLAKITPAELRCLELISKGFTMKEAGKMLNISPRTIEQHLVNMRIKFNFRRTHQLVSYYSQMIDTHSI